jgi:endo-1,4-beta-xylanase
VQSSYFQKPPWQSPGQASSEFFLLASRVHGRPQAGQRKRLGSSLQNKVSMKIKNIVTILLVAFILVSCTPAAKVIPTETAVSTSTSAPAPTATTTATPIPTIPKERFTKGFFEIALPTQDLIEQGLETGVIRQTIDVDKLTFDVHDNLNKPSQQIVFGRNPTTQEIILATRVNPETNEMVWHVAGLRDFADAVGITIGTNLYSTPNGSDGLFSESDQKNINKLVVQEYNHAIVIEVGWGVWLEKFTEGEFDFSLADEAVNLALANGITVEGDDLIYGGSDFDYSYIGQIEDKLKGEGLNDEQIKTRVEGIVKNHINTVMAHFKGRITEWSVLNEWRGQNAENPDVFSRIWNKGQGTDQEFVKMVFETARAADPTSRLFYNDADNISREYYGYKYNLALAQFLQEYDLIDAMGLQFTDMNVANHPSESELIATMQSYNLPIIVTSATFDTRGVSGTEEEIQQKQAETAVEVLAACLKSMVCRDFRMWDGAGDKFSFLGPDAKSAIFDMDMKPKLAYFAIREYLTQIIDDKNSQ